MSESKNNLYFLQGPDQWPIPPNMYSYSMLSTLETCLLRWQLEKGQYGNLNNYPQRPIQQTIAGHMTHEGLDKLFRSLVLKGSPPIRSPDFQSTLLELNLYAFFQKEIDRVNADILEHPRGAGFKLKITPQYLMNEVIDFFRKEYQPANKPSFKQSIGLSEFKPKHHTQSELKLIHPDLPFMGIIDLLKMTPEGPVIVDFKTGLVKSEHLTQVSYYAILWWRNSGTLPAKIEVRYPNDLISKSVTKSELEKIEKDLEDKISVLTSALKSPPAQATKGAHCKYCQVKQFCSKYWEGHIPLQINSRNANKILEAEVIVIGQPTPYGFEVCLSDKSVVPLVFEQDGNIIHGPFIEGETLRILNGQISENGETIELKRWSEVYHLKNE